MNPMEILDKQANVCSLAPDETPNMAVRASHPWLSKTGYYLHVRPPPRHLCYITDCFICIYL